MRISESVLRKIIREEIEVSERMQLKEATIADVISLNQNLGFNTIDIMNAITLLGAVVGGILGHGMAAKGSATAAAGALEKKVPGIKDVVEKISSDEMNEGDFSELAMSLGDLNTLLQAYGALGAVGVGAAAAGSVADISKEAADKAYKMLKGFYNYASGNQPSVNQDDPRA